MEEHVFYQDEHGNKITSVLMHYDKGIYVIGEIASIEKDYGKKEVPWSSLKLASLFFVLGIILTAFEKGLDSLFYGVGGLIFILSAIQYGTQEVDHTLTITLSSGEDKVIVSKNEETIREINDALVESIIFRG